MDLTTQVVFVLLGVIVGGAVAVVAQQIGDDRRDQRIRRSLRAEMRSAIAALTPFRDRADELRAGAESSS